LNDHIQIEGIATGVSSGLVKVDVRVGGCGIKEFKEANKVITGKMELSRTIIEEVYGPGAQPFTQIY